MGYLRFYRRKRIGPGTTLNFGKRGVSMSLGVPGSKFTFGRGARLTGGIPGTGLFYTTKLNKKGRSRSRQAYGPVRSILTLLFFLAMLGLAIEYWLAVVLVVTGAALLFTIVSFSRGAWRAAGECAHAEGMARLLVHADGTRVVPEADLKAWGIASASKDRLSPDRAWLWDGNAWSPLATPSPPLATQSPEPSPALVPFWSTTLRFHGGLSEVQGDAHALALLQLMTDGAKAENRPIEPTLLYGVAGMGLINWAEALSNELGKPLVRVQGPRLKGAADAAAFLSAVEDGGTALVTEADSLSAESADMIASAMTHRNVSWTAGKGSAAQTVDLAVRPMSLICTAYDRGAIPFALRKVLDTAVSLRLIP